MEFNTGRLEAPSRATEYPSGHADQERRRRAQRPHRENVPPPEETESTQFEESDSHQVDDLV
jgi:hypothetical protein